MSDQGGPREFRALLPAEIAGDPQLLLRVEPLADRFSSELPAVQVQSATLSGARTYRWSSDRGTVTLPGLGRGTWRVEVQAVVAHPDGKPVGARLLANGVALATLPDYGDVRRLSVLVPPEEKAQKPDSYWEANVDLFATALVEDFGIGETIQRNFRSGANQQQTFGKFEKALGWFHQDVAKAVS